MFTPKTDHLVKLQTIYPKRIEELDLLFDGKTNIYIDFANVIRWQDKLGWHIDLKRLKQFLDSFDNVREVKFYNGMLQNDPKSIQLLSEARKAHYQVITKAVKKMKKSIDVSSISSDSPEILKQFIRAPLLKKMDIETIEYLNLKIKELNKKGIKYLEDLKCNFDVEIGRDIYNDSKDGDIDVFILWSGDSDFADPVEQVLDERKKVVIFSTARKVSFELNELRKKGLLIFDIQKIRNFICWRKEMNVNLKSKKDSNN